MGLFLGRAVAPAMFVALIAGTIVGAVIIARMGAKEGRKTAIPFGPYLALGGLVGLFAGDAIVDWYLDTFTSRAARHGWGAHPTGSPQVRARRDADKQERHESRQPPSARHCAAPKAPARRGRRRHEATGGAGAFVVLGVLAVLRASPSPPTS